MSSLKDLGENGAGGWAEGKELETLLEEELSGSRTTSSSSSTSIPTAAPRPRSFLSRLSGSILNRVVSGGMESPIVKYLLSPSTLHKALNDDPILSHTYRIIFTSAPVQRLLTPQALSIILDSSTASRHLTPEFLLWLLNHPLTTSFLLPSTFKMIWSSKILLKLFSSSAIISYMESEGMRKMLMRENIHEIFYSPLFNQLMDVPFFISFLRSGPVRAAMSEDAVFDALASPPATRLLGNKELIHGVGELEGVQNLLHHPRFKEHLLLSIEYLQGLYERVDKAGADNAGAVE